MKKLLGCFLCLMLMVFFAAPAAALPLPYDTTLAAVDKADASEYPYAPSLGDANVLAWLNSVTGDLPTEQIPYVGTSFDPGFSWTYAVVHIGGGGIDHDLFAYKDDVIPVGGDDILQHSETYERGVSFVRYYGSSPVPEPTTMLLLGAGLVGLAGLGRKKFKK
jgi:PEP-CTERM motif-containing protein